MTVAAIVVFWANFLAIPTPWRAGSQLRSPLGTVGQCNRMQHDTRNQNYGMAPYRRLTLICWPASSTTLFANLIKTRLSSCVIVTGRA